VIVIDGISKLRSVSGSPSPFRSMGSGSSFMLTIVEGSGAKQSFKDSERGYCYAPPAQEPLHHAA